MMTKQDFERMAQALGSADTLDQAIANVTDACAAGNPAFDRRRFEDRVRRVWIGKWGDPKTG